MSVISLVTLVLADGCSLARDIAVEIGRLNGRWECVGVTVSSKPVPRGQWKRLGLVIAGRNWTLTQEGGW
jgi:hypothetical protein